VTHIEAFRIPDGVSDLIIPNMPFACKQLLCDLFYIGLGPSFGQDELSGCLTALENTARRIRAILIEIANYMQMDNKDDMLACLELY
jgi:hypothetical protein